jgi:hypothetical protein
MLTTDLINLANAGRILLTEKAIKTARKNGFSIEAGADYFVLTNCTGLDTWTVSGELGTGDDVTIWVYCGDDEVQELMTCEDMLDGHIADLTELA